MKIWKITAALLILAVLSCRKEPASWNSDWNLVLIQDTLKLDNLVTEEILGVNSNSSYHLLINRNLLDLNINDVVALPDTLIEQTINIPVAISVPPGIQFIDQIENNEFNFQGLELKRVILNEGRAMVKISSPIGATCIVTLTLPGVKKDGVTFVVDTEVPPGTTANPSAKEINVDLTGYDIDLRGVNGDIFNMIQSQFRVKTDPNGSAVNVNPSQQVKFEVRFYDMKPRYAQGYFGNRVFEEVQDINLDFMNRIVSGAIDIENVNLKLTLLNGIMVGARGKVNLLEGENANGNSITLSHPQIGPWIWINQALGNWEDIQASSHEINLSSGSSNIESFIENLPRILRVNFAFEINPFGNTSGGWDELYINSFVRARLTADMPLAIGMNQLTLRDTFNLKYKQSGAIAPNSGTIKIKTFNAFSLSATISLQILNENNASILTKAGDGNIQGSNTISNFAPMNVVPSEVNFHFDEQEMINLRNMHRIVLTAVFNSPNIGQIAQIYAGQFLAFKIFSNLKLNTQF